jgi:signal transduction histidine kinase
MHEMTDDIREIEALISDLLTSGRLQLREGAGVPLERDEVDIRPMLEHLATKVDAKVDVSDPDLSARIDGLLIERLLSNLLANGRRACPDGEIVVAARADADRLRLTVSDTGPGVPLEHREAIFEPFTRLDAARDRDRGGVGLGLYLARQICVAHGGTIEVTDRPDGRAGAHFVVELPRSPVATAAAST